MGLRHEQLLSRRHFCLCCITGAAFAATGGWFTPRQAFAEARGLVTLIKDSAATSPITAYKLRGNVTVLEGSGGNVAVSAGPDGKLLVDAGISVSRSQLTKALSDLGPDPVAQLINTHWHFDHASGNDWLHSVGAKIIAHENTRKHLSEVQRVEEAAGADAEHPSDVGVLRPSGSRPINLEPSLRKRFGAATESGILTPASSKSGVQKGTKRERLRPLGSVGSKEVFGLSSA
jgi:beta-lactamase superfamily II metal-dependent hydrolase